jgi:hypothetical protein
MLVANAKPSAMLDASSACLPTMNASRVIVRGRSWRRLAESLAIQRARQ